MFDSLIKAIQDSRKANIYAANEDTLTDRSLQWVPSRSVETINCCSLGSLIEYVQDLSTDDEADILAVLIDSPEKVAVISAASSMRGDRQVYFVAKAEIPEIKFDFYYEREMFQILLASRFVQTKARDSLIQLVGQISESAIKQTDDDGISQTVTVKRGITRNGEVIVPPTITLSPYRTFSEIQQPESEFVFRMKSFGDELRCALFEADGGAWRLQARHSIRDYLVSRLGETPTVLA